MNPFTSSFMSMHMSNHANSFSSKRTVRSQNWSATSYHLHHRTQRNGPTLFCSRPAAMSPRMSRLPKPQPVYQLTSPGRKKQSVASGNLLTLVDGWKHDAILNRKSSKCVSHRFTGVRMCFCIRKMESGKASPKIAGRNQKSMQYIQKPIYLWNAATRWVNVGDNYFTASIESIQYSKHK